MEAWTMTTLTSAQRMTDDLAARRALARLQLPIPAELANEAITARYCVGVDVAKGPGRGATVRFVDGSAARLKDDQWEVIS
jgi:hypothetical protein